MGYSMDFEPQPDNRLSPLFFAGHDVITGLREATGVREP